MNLHMVCLKATPFLIIASLKLQ